MNPFKEQNDDMKRMLTELREAAAGLREALGERTLIDEREAAAHAEIEEASATGKIDSDKVQSKITRVSAVITVCRSRRERVEAGLTEEADRLMSDYLGARGVWNSMVQNRREIARVAFKNACLPFWNHDEAAVAEALVGIIPPSISPLFRGCWSGYALHHSERTPARTLEEVEQFLNFIKQKSKLLSIPID